MSTRREFLKTAGLAGVAAAAPAVIRSTALGKDGAVAPSDRIIAGGIGLRGRGMGDLGWLLPHKDVQFVAICDAQRSARENAKKFVDQRYGNTDCKAYPEVREFLAERTDIDAILTATGDRWHALMSIWAMRAGKDVYTEKPSAMTIAEGQAVVATAKRYGRVYQTGTQRLSESHHVFCYELARTGRLGKVHTVYAHIAPWDDAYMKHDWLPAQPEPPKDQVDWDAWLGPCPWRPFNPSYVGGGWRGHYDFHTSCIGEWGAHTFAQAQEGLNMTHTSPVEYEYVNNTTGDGMVTHFANGVKMILSRGNYKGVNLFRGSCGARFEGPEGWATSGDGGLEVSKPAFMADQKKLLRDYQARTQRALDHMRNWLDCIRSRRLTVANPVVMHRAMTTVHAANICMWLKRSLKYDPIKEEFVNDPEANRLRARAMRAPYTY